MAGKVVFAAFRAQPGKMNELLEIISQKRTFMKGKGYYSNKHAFVLTAEKDPQLVIEVFEWAGLDEIDSAHNDPEVHEIWNRMYEICTEVGSKPCTFPGADESFPLFDPVEV